MKHYIKYIIKKITFLLLMDVKVAFIIYLFYKYSFYNLTYVKVNEFNLITENSISVIGNSELDWNFCQINQLCLSWLQLEQFVFDRQIWWYLEVPAFLKQHEEWSWPINLVLHIDNTKQDKTRTLIRARTIKIK